jgi:D-glycero-alpha-D-manno-heptose 1-phosphate guanylyltransferase
VKPILVLAGGVGSRLKSAVSDVPKPLAPVCGKPFLQYLLEHLVSQGAKEFILLLHYEAELIQSVVTKLSKHDIMEGVAITTIVEGISLGTGGSILNAVDTLSISDSFLVVNADTWLGDGLEQLSCSPINSIASVRVEDCSRYGALVAEDGKIEGFLEKKLSFKGGLINAGLYHLSPDIFLDFSKGVNFSLEGDIFPHLVDSSLLSTVQLDTEFIDIGIPQDYFRFCSWIESGKAIEL